MRISVERLDNDTDGSVNVLVNVEDASKLYLVYKMMAELADTADEAEADPDPRPVKTYAGGKPNYVQEQEQEEDAANEAEDEAWEFLQRMRSVQERNKAAMAAWQAAGLFVAQNADRLGRLSLREAFEKGYMEGYHKAFYGDKEEKGRDGI